MNEVFEFLKDIPCVQKFKKDYDTMKQNRQLIDCNQMNIEHMDIHMKVYNRILLANSKIDEILRRTKQKCKVISNLICDLLDLAKFENSVFKINDDYFNLFEVITEAFNIVAYSAEEKNIKLFLEFD
jgi:hypothetical protein